MNLFQPVEGKGGGADKYRFALLCASPGHITYAEIIESEQKARGAGQRNSDIVFQGPGLDVIVKQKTTLI